MASRSSSIAVEVGRVGDADEQRVAPQGVRDRDDALENVERDEAGGRLVHLGESQIDEGKLMPGSEDPGDAVARGDALLDERLGERACGPRPAAHERKLVGGNELGRGKQVGDELGELVDAVLAAERRAQPAARWQHGAEEGGFLALVAHAIPRTRYRHEAARPLGG